MNNLLQPLARVFVAAIFLMSGAGKIFGFAGTAAMMAGVGFPAPELFLLGAIAFEIIGGLFLLFGFQARVGALLLIAFLIPATLIFHAAQLGDAAQAQNQMIQTLKNLAIVGALLNFVIYGAGAFALDNWLAKTRGVQLDNARRVEA